MTIAAEFSPGSVLSAFILSVDSGCNLMLGAILFFAPDKVGDLLLQRRTDGVHWHLLRCIGGQLIAAAFVFYRFRRRTAETRTTCFVLRLVTGLLSIFLYCHARSVHPHLIHPAIGSVIIYGSFAAIALYSTLLFMDTGWRVGDLLVVENKIGNFLYQLDSIASVTIGMAWICNPQWLLHRQVRVTMDESHEFCGQLMGVLFVSSQVISVHALHWRQHADRSLAAEARALCCVCILAAQIWSQVAYGEHWSGAHWVGISLFSTWTVISIVYRIGIYLTSTTTLPSAAKKSFTSKND